MGVALAFLSRIDLRLVLAGLLIVSLGGAWLVVRHKDRQIETVRIQLATARASIADLEAGIDEQNAAVDAAAAEFRARQAAARRAIELAPMVRPRVMDAMREPPHGESATDRMGDIDRRFLEAIQ